jgi:hypothetical protein
MLAIKILTDDSYVIKASPAPPGVFGKPPKEEGYEW